MKKKKKPSCETRNQLILSGIEELNHYGFHDFSVRRVAKRCDVSCAAPYKHFADKQEFVASIIEYINKKWYEQQDIAMAKIASSSSRVQLLEMSIAYIRFLVENPCFRSIIMLNYEDFDERYKSLRGKLSIRTYDIVSKYCDEVNMPADMRKRKTYIIRSLIYGAALFFENGELEYNEENMKMIASVLNREFDLP